MDYDEMIRRIRRLEFIRNEEKANVAAKGILAVLAGSLDEQSAGKITGKFGELLMMNRPGVDQKRMENISMAEYLRQIGVQYKISSHQARMLVRNVLYFAKEASGESALVEIGKSLPNDWAEAFQNA